MKRAGSHTEQARGGRVLLDGLGHVVLYSLPDLPLKARMQDVERLHGMKPSVSLVLSEDGVVCLVVPLWGGQLFYEAYSCLYTAHYCVR